MSYRLRKLWDKNPKAAAKESCFDVIAVALVALFALSGGCKKFPPFWQILIVIFVAGRSFRSLRMKGKYLTI